MSSEEKERIIQKLVSNMVYVSGGTFKMGGKRKPFFDEKPTHSVTLSSYYIGKYEVTQAEWKTVMGSNPSEIKGDDRPVENVSWDDCQTFISRLNSITGRSFSLPTEAQWEFSARGGNSSRGYKYSGSNNVGDVAWYIDNSGGTTHDVGTKSPNELGLYDMSGNVWEWCSDWGGNYSSNSQTNPTGPSSGSGRVNRGGSCGGLAGGCRVSCRYFNSPGRRYGGMGLRLVL
jgi:formylglycine-generating enzyme required for sulfatase activity